MHDHSVVEDEYIVVLNYGHSLQQHFEQIGTNLAVNASMFHPINSINGYRARLPYELLHETIRFDPGVEFIERDTHIELIKPFNGHDVDPADDGHDDRHDDRGDEEGLVS